jgi:hypothetical protein
VLPDHRWRACVRPAQLMMLEHVCKPRCGAPQQYSSIIYNIAEEGAERSCMKTMKWRTQKLRRAATCPACMAPLPGDFLRSSAFTASLSLCTPIRATSSCRKASDTRGLDSAPRRQDCACSNDNGAGRWMAAGGATAHKPEIQQLRAAARLAWASAPCNSPAASEVWPHAQRTQKPPMCGEGKRRNRQQT